MSAKHEAAPPQDFSVLEDTYRIVGELNARDHVRGYLANRISDGADVLVLVEESPDGDTGNALTHFAADSNLLATLEHRNLIPIHEGRWLSPTSFALVTDRCPAPTLATLVARGESWSYPRIATILHEVNGLLEWARRQKVVHRTLTLDTIHLEPDTDRVLVSFVAQPLTRQGAPGAEGDAHTIASLAWTLITRGRDLPATVDDSLGIVRPELPRRLVESTDALLHAQRVGETDPPAPLDYIAMVAMADPLRAGEVDAAELQAVVLQEQVLEREEWARKEAEYNARMEEMERSTNEAREEMERTLLAEREELTETLAAERRQLADERAEMERLVAEERRQMADERAEMERLVAEERRQLADERAELERTVADERAAMEEAMRAERAQMEETLRMEREQMAETLRTERERTEQALLAEREELTTTLADERRQLAADRAAAEAEVAAELAQLAGRRTTLEEELAAEREALAASRSDAERELAAARAEFEAATLAQREEFERLLAEERAEFDRTIMAERNALEAEKEGLAVFHAAERAQIDAERRALEELYLSYQAEGGIPDEPDDARDVTTVGPDATQPRVADRPVRGFPALLAHMAPMAFAQPITEPEPPAGEPAETETGQTRRMARRSMRAAMMAPAAVLVLVALLLAAAFGIGNRDNRDPVDARVDRDLQRAAQPTPGVSPAGRGLVIDSAGGTVTPGAPRSPGARTP